MKESVFIVLKVRPRTRKIFNEYKAEELKGYTHDQIVYLLIGKPIPMPERKNIEPVRSTRIIRRLMGD